MTVLAGSTHVHLKWNYIKPTGWKYVIKRTVFSRSNGDIGSKDHLTGNTEIDQFYRTRFAIDAIEVATLIIKKVTKSEESVYHCRLEMTKLRYTWWRSPGIRVIATGNKYIFYVWESHKYK